MRLPRAEPRCVECHDEKNTVRPGAPGTTYVFIYSRHHAQVWSALQRRSRTPVTLTACPCHRHALGCVASARPLPCLARTSTTQVHVDWPHDRPLPFSISVEVTNDSDFKVKRKHRFRFDGGAHHQKAVGFFFEVCFRHTHFPTSIPLMLSYLIDLRLARSLWKERNSIQ